MTLTNMRRDGCNRANCASRILMLALACGLVAAAGCGRGNVQPKAAPQARERESHVRTAGLQDQVNQSRMPDETNVPPAGLKTVPTVLEVQAEDLASQPAGGQSQPADAGASNPKPKLDIQKPQSLPKPLMASAKKEPIRPASQPGGSKKREADALFEKPTVLFIEIAISDSGLNILRGSRRENGQRPTAKVTVREGDNVYTNVAVHLKGAAGSFRPLDNKPAMTLNFDKFAPGQNFHGLHKISLNNSVQDSTFLSEKISRELFIAAGVPAPRASHAVVKLNGRDLGLYVVLEGANKQFLKRYFDNPSGNLYDGGFCREISARMHVNSGDDRNNNSGLRNLCAVVRGGHPTYAQLEKVLDMDRFISMMVLEVMLGHWDGYTMNKNNWRIFHDLDANRMVFIPHGLDQLFGRPVDQNGSLLPNSVQGEVSRAVLATQQGKDLYNQRFAQIFTNVFKVDEIVSRVDELSAGVSSALAETHPQLARSFQQKASSFRQRIVRRGETLRRALGAPAPTLEFGNDGVLQLTGWKQSIVSGDPVLAQGTDPSGKSILSIAAGDSPSSGSWRTRVMLGPGHYQFEGRMRVQGVTVTEGDQRSGAGLRISKGTMPRKLTGTSDWKKYSYVLEVVDQSADVELICELKATAGEAWFDTSSLRLIRQQ